jgi:hypothetical protein
MRSATCVKKLPRACSPSLPTSMPASICRATTAAVAARASRASSPASTGSPRLRRTWSAFSASGLGKLPACVVRVRESLRFMGRA